MNISFSENSILNIYKDLLDSYYESNGYAKIKILETLCSFVKGSEDLRKNKNIMGQIQKMIIGYLLNGDFKLIATYKTLFSDTPEYKQLEEKIDMLKDYPDIIDEPESYELADLILQKELDEAVENLNIKIQQRIANQKYKQKFDVGQIVGAYDVTGKPWMAKILHVFKPEHSNLVWYFVHYEGFNSVLDEWIPQGRRIRFFNPYKHKYKKYVDFMNSEEYEKIKQKKQQRLDYLASLDSSQNQENQDSASDYLESDSD